MPKKAAVLLKMINSGDGEDETPRKPVTKNPPITMEASSHPERGIHGRTEVFFKPPDQSRQDTRPLREKNLNKRAMDLKQISGIVNIKGGQMQFGRHREGRICPGKIAQDKGDLEWSDKHAQTSLPSTGDSADLFPGGGGTAAALASAEFNTTLRLADRIRRLEQQEPDLTQLAEQRLQQCPSAAQQLQNKAYERLNYGQHEYQYGDLVPVEVDESVLVCQVEARKQARVEAYRPEPGRRPPAPHLGDLFHLAVQHEFPVPPAADELHVSPPRPRPVGYDQLARRACQRHRQLFGGQRR